MSISPIKFKVLKTDNKNLQAYDTKIVLIIAKYEENKRKLELETLKQKISEVDDEIVQKKLQKQAEDKPKLDFLGKYCEQKSSQADELEVEPLAAKLEVKPLAEKLEVKLETTNDQILKVKQQPSIAEEKKVVHKVLPDWGIERGAEIAKEVMLGNRASSWNSSNDRTRSRTSQPKGLRAQTIKVYGERGFEVLTQAQFHAVFSEAGKTIDIITAEEGQKEAIIVFDSIASATSAVKHAPKDVCGIPIVVRHA